MCLHKTSAGKIIYHGRDSCDRHRKVIGPGFDRRYHGCILRIRSRKNREVFQKLFQKWLIFITASDPRPGSVCQRRKFKVQVGDYFSHPFRMCGKDLFVGTCGPVKIRINHAPLFCCHRTDQDRIVRLNPGIDQCFRDPEHHGHRRIIILKSVKIRIVMSRKHNHTVFVFSRNLTGNIISFTLRHHPAVRFQCHP